MSASDEVAIDFISTPPGAAVTSDGRFVCPATPCTRKLKKGVHEIVMKLEWFVPTSLRFTADQRATLPIQLAPDFGTLDITTDPLGMKVAIDGREIGYSPVNEWRLKPGIHQVELTDKCFQTLSRTVLIENGRSVTISETPVPRFSIIDIMALAGKSSVAATASFDEIGGGEVPGRFRIPTCTNQVVVSGRSAKHGVWRGPVTLRDAGTSRLEVPLSDAELIAARRQRDSSNESLEKELKDESSRAWAPRIGLTLDTDLIPGLWLAPTTLVFSPRRGVLLGFGGTTIRGKKLKITADAIEIGYRHSIGDVSVILSFNIGSILVPPSWLLVTNGIGIGGALGAMVSGRSRDAPGLAELTIIPTYAIASWDAFFGTIIALLERDMRIASGLNLTFNVLKSQKFQSGINVGFRYNSDREATLFFGFGP